jgi:hypothetical protein
LRGEDGGVFAGALEPESVEFVCAVAAAVKIEKIKMTRKILFMIDLTTLESILSGLLLLERFRSSFVHFPEA